MERMYAHAVSVQKDDHSHQLKVCLRNSLRSHNVSHRNGWGLSVYDCTIGFDATVATTTDGKGSPIPRTGSPDRLRSRSSSPLRRNASPSRSALDESAASAAEVDPEAVRLALRDYVTLMATTERDRDDAQAQVCLLPFN